VRIFRGPITHGVLNIDGSSGVLWSDQLPRRRPEGKEITVPFDNWRVDVGIAGAVFFLGIECRNDSAGLARMVLACHPPSSSGFTLN
jgi:hypothetical protein